MHGRLVADPALLEIEVEAYARGGARNLLAQALLELFHVGHQSLVLRLHQYKVATLEELDL